MSAIIIGFMTGRAVAAMAMNLLVLSAGHAQSGSTAVTPDTRFAMPGLHRIGVAIETKRGGSFAATAGYGWTESVLTRNDTHHRLVASAAFSLRPLYWLTAGLSITGRYDKHMRLTGGDDDGFVADPRIMVRAGKTISKGLILGGQITGWVPGNRLPSFVLKATTIDLEALAAYQIPAGSSTITLASRAGFRIDQTRFSINRLDTLSPGDRLGLEISNYNAVLTGLGVQWQRGRWDAFIEGTWDIMVGSKAPSAIVSPFRTVIGARLCMAVDCILRVGVTAELSINAITSKRPDLNVDGALVPTEPAIMGLLGLFYRWPFWEPSPPPPPKVEPAQMVMTKGTLRGTIRGKDNALLPNIQVHVRTTNDEFDAYSSADGKYEFQQIQSGEAVVTVEALKHEKFSTSVIILPDRVRSLDIVLVPLTPRGQIRGAVQSFNGKPVRATIRVEPIGYEVTAAETGEFQIDVPPGQYRVLVKAAGYTEQRRRVKVEEFGVTVLNVDMRKRR